MSNAQNNDLSLSRRALLTAGVVAAGAHLIPAYAADRALPRLVGIDQLPHGVRIRFDTQVTTIMVRAGGVASVAKGPVAAGDPDPGFFAVPDRATAKLCRFSNQPAFLRMEGDGITVDIDRATGNATFRSPDGTQRLVETAAAEPIAGVPIAYVQSFGMTAGLALHGLGQFREPDFEYSGKQVFLAHANSDAVNAFLVTNGGWGLLWDTGTAAYCKAEAERLSFHAIAGDVVRYHVVVGDTIDALISGYRRLTGRAAMLGKWAYGFWQSKERYGSQQQLMEAVDIFRARKLPLDAIVLDWRYWGENENFNGLTFEPANFPDPAAMTAHVHRAKAHILASVWPAFGTQTAIYKEMAATGRLLPEAHWCGGKVFDATAPDARAIYWKHIDKGLMQIGMDGLWTDACEPEFMSTGNRYIATQSFAANGNASTEPIVRNLLTYSWYQSRDLSRQMRTHYPQRRPCILTRSYYPGQQAFGAITWSGDIFASWQTLRNQIVAAMNMALAGNPYWTCDIGGFLTSHRYPDGLADPAFKELYTRWFQFGAFLPIFRAHGSEVPREPWKFGEPGDPFYEAQVKALKLRYTLMPYIYGTAAQVAQEDQTFLRPLIMDFAEDAKAREQTAQYMFGPSLLVRLVDRPLAHVSTNSHEFLPNAAVQGDEAPAARVRYYEGSQFDRLVADSLTDDLKLSWFGDLPGPLHGKPYSVRWTGKLVPQESGLHRFVITARGAVRLTLDGKVRAEGTSRVGNGPDGATGAVSAKASRDDKSYTFDVMLEAGKPCAFELEQRQPTPDVVSLWVEWITPSQRALAALPPKGTIDVYLPAGTDWYDFADRSRHAGGRTVAVTPPLDAMPLYARAGAIIPMTPGIEYAGQAVKRTELHIFAGADGHFQLYADAGDGDAYRNGDSARVDLNWNERRRTLSMGGRQGSFPDMESGMDYVAFLHDGSGKPQERDFHYAGKAITIAFAR